MENSNYLNVDEMANWITEQTGIPPEVVMLVLDLEEEYLDNMETPDDFEDD